MSSKLAKAAEAMFTIRNHVTFAMTNCGMFSKLGFTELGFPSDPATQRAALEAAIDELQHAVHLLKTTRWPTPEQAEKL